MRYCREISYATFRDCLRQDYQLECYFTVGFVVYIICAFICTQPTNILLKSTLDTKYIFLRETENKRINVYNAFLSRPLWHVSRHKVACTQTRILGPQSVGHTVQLRQAFRPYHIIVSGHAAACRQYLTSTPGAVSAVSGVVLTTNRCHFYRFFFFSPFLVRSHAMVRRLQKGLQLHCNSFQAEMATTRQVLPEVTSRRQSQWRENGREDSVKSLQIG